MKKITVIASLLILFSACQKADIRPNATSSSSEPAYELKKACADPGTTTSHAGDDAGSLSTGTNPTIDPNAPSDPNGGGDITDPLRKKDQKDNK